MLHVMIITNADPWTADCPTDGVYTLFRIIMIWYRISLRELGKRDEQSGTFPSAPQG